MLLAAGNGVWHLGQLRSSFETSPHRIYEITVTKFFEGLCGWVVKGTDWWSLAHHCWRFEPSQVIWWSLPARLWKVTEMKLSRAPGGQPPSWELGAMYVKSKSKSNNFLLKFNWTIVPKHKLTASALNKSYTQVILLDLWKFRNIDRSRHKIDKFYYCLTIYFVECFFLCV